MSNNSSSQIEAKVLAEGLSKREQMKLEKAIKRFQSQENAEIKHPKRRGHAHLRHNEPNNRKQIKIDSSLRPQPYDQNISSPINSSERLSTTPPPPTNHLHIIPSHLNPHYTLPEGEADIFNYLMCYTYAEGEKKIQKQDKDWSKLTQIGQIKLNIINNKASTAIAHTFHHAYSQLKHRIREPFDKAHKELATSALKKQNTQSQ